MATYQSIAEAANVCGETETERVAFEIMEEETSMGKELEEDLPSVVRQFISEKRGE